MMVMMIMMTLMIMMIMMIMMTLKAIMWLWLLLLLLTQHPKMGLALAGEISQCSHEDVLSQPVAPR
eukprot:7683771-Lingulodinium_polyedra.AAC.1